MTVVSNDPSRWPLIIFGFSTAIGWLPPVVYDWVLTLGQEIELIWDRHRGLFQGADDILRALLASSACASFVGVSCLELGFSISTALHSASMGIQMLDGALQNFSGVQMFVLGPRLILSVREYHAKLVAESGADISLSSIVFEERLHVPTSSTM
ncbi:hypothetical protein BD769DRAFT_1385411 [Suillus cothurnatus]|nr:hypothetical protein BD769DRAFT_1385411 [Suillus cothurnatus]